MIEDAVSSLPLPQRLALSYAPRASRNAFAGLLALDTRFAGIVRHAREPMLAQMRLAWWRDVLAKPAAEWPTGEPLLALLAEWQGESSLPGESGNVEYFVHFVSADVSAGG